MNIIRTQDGNTNTLAVEGRLDTTTAPQLEQEVAGLIGNTELLIFDFKSLEYISSAGLRVLLSTQKKISRTGKMIVKNVNDEVMEVFEVTGFTDFLTIE